MLRLQVYSCSNENKVNALKVRIYLKLRSRAALIALRTQTVRTQTARTQTARTQTETRM